MIFGNLRCFARIILLAAFLSFFNSGIFAQNQFVAVISDLNTKTETTLEPGKLYFFEVKKNSVLQSGKLSEVTADSLNFEGKKYSAQQITAISSKKFKRLTGLHKAAKIAGLAGAITFLTGILMSGSADDWQPLEQSYFAKASIISLPLIIPSILFIKIHKGPEFDLIHQHLLEIKKTQ